MTSEERLEGSRGSAWSRIWDTRVRNTVWKEKHKEALKCHEHSFVHLSVFVPWGTAEHNT